MKYIDYPYISVSEYKDLKKNNTNPDLKAFCIKVTKGEVTGYIPYADDNEPWPKKKDMLTNVSQDEQLKLFFNEKEAHDWAVQRGYNENEFDVKEFKK